MRSVIGRSPSTPSLDADHAVDVHTTALKARASDNIRQTRVASHHPKLELA